MTNGENDRALRVLRLALAGFIAVAWFVSVAVSLWIPGRAVDPWVHLLTAAIATALFGPSIWKRNGGAK